MIHHLPESSYLGPVAGQRLPKSANTTHIGSVLLPDGKIVEAVVKAFPAPGGCESRQLLNEYIAHFLAERWGYFVPTNVGTVRLTRRKWATLPMWKCLPRCTHATVWWSQLMSLDSAAARLNLEALQDRQPLFRQALESAAADLAACPDLPSVIAFDDVLANINRHPGNVLGPSGKRLMVIDHDQALTGPMWAPEHLVPNASFDNRLMNFIAQFSQWNLPLSSRAVAALDTIEKHASKTLDALDANLSEILPDKERMAVVAFLSARCKRNEKAAQRLGQIA